MSDLNTKRQAQAALKKRTLRPFPNLEMSSRQRWASHRFGLETGFIQTQCYGGKSRRHWYMRSGLISTLAWILRLAGYYKKGIHNAQTIVLREIPLYFPNLPPAFDGFTILQLSDLHLDGMPGLVNRILETLPNTPVDLCVLTGDYRAKLEGPFSHTIDDLQLLIEGIDSKQGFIGVLGNHDSCRMVGPMENLGIKMLINENCWIDQGSQRIQIIGTDDVHFYYTDQALHALKQANNEFSIALIHSPELYDVAAEMGIDLYLCGHTHAGQVCLPGGLPLTKNLNTGKSYYRGWWTYQGMQGFTHAGVGTSSLPIRFNTQAEIIIFQLKTQLSSSI